ncbi:MAG: hypothetical protein ACP5KZ_06980 [bacterium]
MNNIENEEFEEVVLEAFDMDKFLDFLESFGFQIVLISHATLKDLSEICEFGLLLEDEPVGAVRIHYIDNHFWPKGEITPEKKIARLMMPSSWNVIVDPVILVMEKSERIPSGLISNLKSYHDAIPENPEAKQAYEQYTSERGENE